MIKGNKHIFSEFRFHHIGVAVHDIQEAINNYTALFGQNNISKIYHIKSQKIKECFVKNGIDSYIGLVAPSDENSVITNILKKGINYYHIAYKVTDLKDSTNRLENLYYKSLKSFSSEAFNGNNCVFLFTPEGHLIELIEEK